MPLLKSAFKQTTVQKRVLESISVIVAVLFCISHFCTVIDFFNYAGIILFNQLPCLKPLVLSIFLFCLVIVLPHSSTHVKIIFKLESNDVDYIYGLRLKLATMTSMKFNNGYQLKMWSKSKLWFSAASYSHYIYKVLFYHLDSLFVLIWFQQKLFLFYCYLLYLFDIIWLILLKQVIHRYIIRYMAL